MQPQLKPLPFPSEADLPQEAPRPKNPRRAVLLALLFGPLGLFYVSPAAAVFMCFTALVVGLFTVGVGLIGVWAACMVIAASWAMASGEAASPGG